MPAQRHAPGRSTTRWDQPRLSCKQQVGGSSPPASSKRRRSLVELTTTLSLTDYTLPLPIEEPAPVGIAAAVALAG
jgi:hypothetical protein